MAHERTAEEILDQVPGRIDYLIAAVSTSGTIHGVSRSLRATHPELKVIAVDAVGSVLFGGRPGRRRVPGIGASRVPELLNRDEIDDVIRVGDEDAIRGCHDLLSAEAIFAGGSSGSVVAALRRLVPRLDTGSRIVTLFPDRGERYIDLIYGKAPESPADRTAVAGDTWLLSSMKGPVPVGGQAQRPLPSTER
jgi:cysteine synthase A